MIQVDIQEFGILKLEHFVTDYSGTLSEDGRMVPGVREKLNALSEKLTVHVITSDTFGMARKELEGVNCIIHVLEGKGHVLQKENYVLSLGADSVVALGNGNNDAKMLKAAKVGISVCLKEGVSVEALKAAKILVRSPIDAIDLLLNPKRLTATLRM
jgi:soluble P-type ATPase